MSFLAPWFLLGGLAIAGPILFHLIRRVTRDRVLFSSSQFLRPVAPKVTRRRRIQHWILLLLRCACVQLLAMAFARPFFRGNAVLPPIADEGRQIILILDTSGSMQRDGVWNRARSMAQERIAKLGFADELALVAFDRAPRTLLSFDEWKSLSPELRQAAARDRIAALEPGWSGTQLGQALTFAAEQFRAQALAGNTPAQRELVLVSDLQEGAKLDGLQGYEWIAGMNVVIESVAPRQPGNAGVSAAVNSRGNDVVPAARLINSRDSGGEQFRLSWKGASAASVSAYLAPGQTRSVSAPTNAVAARQLELELTGDQEAFDNRAYFVIPETQEVRIAWLGTEPAGDPAKLRFYFERAFPETPRQRIRVAAIGNNEPLSREALSDVAFAILPRSLGAAESEVFQRWLHDGGSALLVLTDDQMGPTLSKLAGVEARVSEAGGDFALLAGIDFNHPLFVPFADPRFSDFTRIHFWKHRRVDLPEKSEARVLAKFDDETPALIEFVAGKGSLLVLTSGWNPADSQFAVASKFPPLMQTLLAWARAVTPSRHQFLTGDSIPSPAAAGVSVQWKLPNGKSDSRTDGKPLVAEQPGFYSATVTGRESVFAVNLPADESRTAPMPIDVLARLGVPIGRDVQLTLEERRERALSMQRAELESQQKLWRWFLVGALGMILAETVVSGWLARAEMRKTDSSSRRFDATSSGAQRKQEEFA